MINTGDWIGELTTTSGTGDVELGGALEGFARFNVLGAGQVWYTIVDGLNRESGIGTSSGILITRDTIHSTLVDGVYSISGDPIELSGNADVYCTFNAAAFNDLSLLAGIIESLSASDIANIASGIVTSGNVQGAIDELAGFTEALQNEYANLTALNVANVPDDLIASVNVQYAINEISDHLLNLLIAVQLNQIGGYTENRTTVNAIDASETNFVLVSDGATPISVTNVPEGAYTLTIELSDYRIDLSGLAIKWAGGTPVAPTINTDLIFLTTSDGVNWLGSASLGYV